MGCRNRTPDDDYDEGRTEGIPAEVVFAKMREIIRQGPKTRTPAVPSTYREIKDQALHLPHGDFYLLLTHVEAALPASVDAAWRADMQRRIAAIPAEVERRYRYYGGWRDDDGGGGWRHAPQAERIVYPH